MRVIAPLWLAFVVAMSLMPLQLKDRVGTTGILHDPGHFVVFLITAVLLCRTAPDSRSRLLRFASICCFGILMEILETIIFHNLLEWHDILIDFFGAAAGLAIVSLRSLRSDQIRQAATSRTGDSS